MGNIESGQILAAMWDNFDVRVKQICKFYHITKLEMAARIGTTQSNLSVLNNGKQHHTDAYRILLGFPEINARWLLFGEGEMFTHQAPSVDSAQEDEERYQHTDASHEILWQRYDEAQQEIGALKKTIADIQLFKETVKEASWILY